MSEPAQCHGQFRDQPCRSRDRFFRAQGGQATIELLVVLPLIVLAVAAGWQCVVAGHAWWLLQKSASAGARSYAVELNAGNGSPREAASASASSVLPVKWAERMQMRVLHSGGGIQMRVGLPMPLIAPLRSLAGSRVPQLSAEAGVVR